MTADLWAITGAGGYLGRALRADLDASSIPSRGLSRRTGAEIAADVRDRDALRELVRGATVVAHLAAYVHRGARGGAAARECWSVNVEGTQAVIDAVAAESPGAFLIFVSSANVYGPSDVALDESAPLRPRTPYGRSKLEAEQRVLRAIRAGAIRGCILRPAMIFGPGAPGNLARLTRMVRSGWVVEIAHGVQRKSIVPVSHAAGAIRAVAARQAACNGEAINVAGEALTIDEIVRALGVACGAVPRVISIPRWIAIPPARVASVVAPSLAAMAETYMTSAVLSGEKLRRLTGFDPPESARALLSCRD
jgi:nucleoside-diphosphate-sugar epimerase